MVTKRRRSNAPNNSNSSSKVFLPIELITEILSHFSVKAIMRIKCVSKSWNALTSESNFVEKHLNVSSQNPHLTLSWYERKLNSMKVVPCPVHLLLEKQSATVPSYDFHRVKEACMFVASCNGLLCFVSRSWKPAGPCEYSLYFSNPATRTVSEKFEFTFGRYDFKFIFGYDASMRTHKVVAFCAEKYNKPSEVKIFNLGDNCWRNIQNFPLVPVNNGLNTLDHYYMLCWLNNGVHFCGTINWLALDKSIKKFVIVSLDLSTETYKQFLLPLGFDEVPFSKMVLRVLMDCLCFSYDSNKTELILWKMKEYGVQESWTQLFKISYQNLAMQLPPIRLPELPMHNFDYSLHYRSVCLFVDGDIAIFASKWCKQSLIYNLKDKTVVKIKSRHTIKWFVDSKDYVESLVSVH